MIRFIISSLKIPCSVFSILLLLLPVSSLAIDITDKLSLNGFYSINASLSDKEDITLPAGNNTPNTLEDGEVNFHDSLLGLQLDYTLTNDLSLTLQAISTRQSDDNYDPSIEWAYLSYDLGNELNIRGGKLKLPFLQGTELRFVGFSRLWVRPLVPSSGTAGFESYDGVEVIKRTNVGDYHIKLNAAFGVADHLQDFVDNDHVKLLSTHISKDDFWINLALFHAQFDISTIDGRRLIGEDAEVLMVGLEAEQKFDPYIINFGYAYGDADFIPEEKLAYLSIAYQFDRLTPYWLYQYRKASFTAPARLPPPGAPPPPMPIRSGDLKTHSYSIGLRYDLGNTYAIKAQFTKQTTDDASILNRPAIESDANIYSIVFEGVF